MYLVCALNASDTLAESCGLTALSVFSEAVAVLAASELAALELVAEEDDTLLVAATLDVADELAEDELALWEEDALEEAVDDETDCWVAPSTWTLLYYHLYLNYW